VVVEDQDLQIRIVAVRQCTQAGADPLFFIPGGDQYRDFRGRGKEVCDRRKPKGFEIQKVVEKEKAQRTEDEDVKNIHGHGESVLGVRKGTRKIEPRYLFIIYTCISKNLNI
jgi:hypothetical protein